MTFIIGKRQDKERCIHLVDQAVKLFILPGVTPADAALVMQHLEWLKRQSEDLKVNCQFLTIPETRTTRLLLDLSFAPVVAPIRKN